MSRKQIGPSAPVIVASFLLLSALTASASKSATAYTYDALGRVISVRQDDGKQTTFSYDAAGNRTQTSVTTTTANRAPIAAPDAVTIFENQSSATVDPRANDSDPDGNAVTIFSVSSGNYGTASWDGTALTYASNRKRNGTDSVLYTVSDGQGMTATGEVVITLANLNPVAVNDTIVLPVNSIKVLAPTSNDSDPGGDELTITSVSAPAHGTTFLLAAEGFVNYTPVANYTGPDTFTYAISDGDGGTALATVDVTVTSTPPAPLVAVADSALLQGVGGTGDPATVIFDPRLNDMDAFGGVLRIVSVSQPPGGVAEIIDAGTRIRITSIGTGVDAAVGSFSYTIADSIGRQSTADITSTIHWN